jgi:DNA recombination protein RmuC
MEILLIVALTGALGAALAVLVVRSSGGRHLPDDLAALQDQVRGIGERVAADSSLLRDRLEGIDSRMIGAQSSSVELARDIFESLGDVKTATATVAEQAREFSALQDLLKAPKARGGIGEAMLEELLRQVLPPQSYEMQHRFGSGTIVDAVVQVGGKLVCIDSKFPLSNYRLLCEATDATERAQAERAFAADVSKHIRDIGSRYIVPDEDTFDFAVMYVPAEGVYAEVLRLSHRNRPLFESAIEARVVPMSPLTMFGYLQTVLFGLKCLRIEETAREVLDFCGRLEQDVERFAGEYEVLGRHLTNARSKYEEGQKRLERFRGKLERVVDFEDSDLLSPASKLPGPDSKLRGPDDRPHLEAIGD